MSERGRLYLIPSPLGDNDPQEVIPGPVLNLLPEIRTYVVEEIKTARRYLSKAGLRGHIGELEFHVLNEHTTVQEVEAMASLFDEGGDIGLITEAGLPAVADPGSALVALCHRKGIEVVPFVGPSSLMMALMSSGLNGQSFAFCGYLPAKTEERRNAIRAIEKRSAIERQTQIFIETPYRNRKMFDTLLSTLRPSTRMCVAAGITTPDEWIHTHTIGEWRRLSLPDLSKVPAIFLIL